ncbi:ribonuclease P protein component [Phormidium sp. CLA17]|uniref:ribonuclease P protein component n=1 Tax=Leptolyngbya sp. Cla-17 TaxID=2803751 RepID=UPI001490E9A4|nr:ribonuclease P protein component [Leptolyngbya sp. Cla-17]MBM0741926.1 ribonuclease P protein component [Leptolyngbya sp. Cla-17]
MGLPKQNRLKHRKDFSAVYQRGTRIKTKHLSLRILRGSPKKTLDLPLSARPVSSTQSANAGSSTRVGISISLKVDKRSVVRNRIRRQIQAAFRQLLPVLAKNLDILVVVHPPAIQCGYLQFLQELKQLLADFEVLNGD